MIPAAVAGLTAGPLSHAIDARWVMAYAAALGETDPRYFDTMAEGSAAVHPVFPVCYEWPVMLEIRARTLPPALAARTLHATYHLVLHRPPRVGDELLTRARVIAVKGRRTGTLVLVRLTTTARNGEPVTTTDYGSLVRDTQPQEEREVESPLPWPVPAGIPSETRWSEVVAVASGDAHVYSACARIWNPIHTDVAVARGAGLPGPILHGTATLALAVSRVVSREAAGEPSHVREVAARFTAPVGAPATFTVRAGARHGRLVTFDAVAADGVIVLQGALRR